jgi:hypothetical protein
MNERIKELLITKLTDQGFSYREETPIMDQEKGRYILFSKGGIDYLLSVHSGVKQREYNPNLDTFKAALRFAEINNLHPLPIFDAEGSFFRPDTSGSRETQGDRRWLSSLELIAEEKFGEVTYASQSSLFVVSYGPVIANYTYSTPRGQDKGAVIPTQKIYPEMKTRRLVTTRRDFGSFTLDSLEGHGIIKAPRLVYPRSERVIDSRGQQLSDLGLELDELTLEDRRLIRAAGIY